MVTILDTSLVRKAIILGDVQIEYSKDRDAQGKMLQRLTMWHGNVDTEIINEDEHSFAELPDALRALADIIAENNEKTTVPRKRRTKAEIEASLKVIE